jgi:hypothetical protein
VHDGHALDADGAGEEPGEEGTLCFGEDIEEEVN